MMNWICYECRSYDVYESRLVRLNRLACIIDDQEDVLEMEKPTSWCEDCGKNVILIEADKPKYREV
jgi:hypothetical protein